VTSGWRSDEAIIRDVASAQSEDEPGPCDRREPFVPPEAERLELRAGASNEYDDLSKYGGIPYGYGCP
jgi:hypothetical protein